MQKTETEILKTIDKFIKAIDEDIQIQKTAIENAIVKNEIINTSTYHNLIFKKQFYKAFSETIKYAIEDKVDVKYKVDEWVSDMLLRSRSTTLKNFELFDEWLEAKVETIKRIQYLTK